MILMLCGVFLSSRTRNLLSMAAPYGDAYHDASHFNREYKCYFGVPPVRDVQRLREEALQTAGVG